MDSDKASDLPTAADESDVNRDPDENPTSTEIAEETQHVAAGARGTETEASAPDIQTQSGPDLSASACSRLTETAASADNQTQSGFEESEYPSSEGSDLLDRIYDIAHELFVLQGNMANHGAANYIKKQARARTSGSVPSVTESSPNENRGQKKRAKKERSKNKRTADLPSVSETPGSTTARSESGAGIDDAVLTPTKTQPSDSPAGARTSGSATARSESGAGIDDAGLTPTKTESCESLVLVAQSSGGVLSSVCVWELSVTESSPNPSRSQKKRAKKRSKNKRTADSPSVSETPGGMSPTAQSEGGAVGNISETENTSAEWERFRAELRNIQRRLSRIQREINNAPEGESDLLRIAYNEINRNAKHVDNVLAREPLCIKPSAVAGAYRELLQTEAYAQISEAEKKLCELDTGALRSESPTSTVDSDSSGDEASGSTEPVPGPSTRPDIGKQGVKKPPRKR